MPSSHDFIGRQREIASLRKELDRERPSLIVVYGRRRVGKSTLLAHATDDASTIFYQATQVVGSLNLELLKREIQRHLGTNDPILDGITHWEALLSYVVELARKQPGLTLTRIFDEALLTSVQRADARRRAPVAASPPRQIAGRARSLKLGGCRARASRRVEADAPRCIRRRRAPRRSRRLRFRGRPATPRAHRRRHRGGL